MTLVRETVKTWSHESKIKGIRGKDAVFTSRDTKACV